MVKKKNLIFVVLLILSLAFSCKKKEDIVRDETGKKLYNLQPRLEINDEFSFEKKSNIFFDQEIFGIALFTNREIKTFGELAYKGENTYLIKFEKVEIKLRKDNILPDLIYFQIQEKDKKIKRENKKYLNNYSKNLNLYFLTIFEKIDLDLEFKINKDYSVTLLNYNKYFESVKSIAEYENLPKEFQNFFTENELVLFIDEFFSWLPQEKLKRKADWTRLTEYTSPVKINLSETYCLKKVTAEKIYLPFKSENDFGIMEDKFSYTGKIKKSGRVIISRKNSFLKEKTSKTIVNLVHTIIPSPIKKEILESPYSLQQKNKLIVKEKTNEKKNN